MENGNYNGAEVEIPQIGDDSFTNGNGTTKPKVQMDYATDFPSLPDVVASGPAAKKPVSVWARPSLTKKDCVITFRLALDERSTKVKSIGNQSEEHKKAQQISKATGVRIELSEAKDGELTVVLRGEHGNVEEAKARIVRELQTQAHRDVEIPKDHHRKFVGQGGQILRELEAETNCRITVPRKDDPSNVITITGPREGIERAVAHLLSVSERESKLASVSIVCPKNVVPFVKGPFNKNIERLHALGDVKINIPPPSNSNDIIIINGDKTVVHAVADEIRKIVASKSNITSITLTVSRSQHRYISGQHRSGIYQILEETGVFVDLPNEESNSDDVTLVGDVENFAAAIEKVVALAGSVITQQISAPTWLHKYLIGPKGSTLTELVPNRANLKIDFENNGSIYFEGPPEEVKTALTTLSKEVARLQVELAIEKIKVNPSLHRHVIGRNGSLISKIKDETNVQITIPNEETNSDEIVIEGPKNGVKKAVAEIKAIVTKIENEKSRDIIIPQRFHKIIIGSKGAEISKLREAYPNVSFGFPDSTSKSDLVNLRGDKNEVDAVHKKLTAISKDLTEKNYQQTVTLFKEFTKFIVGKGGATIRKLREETDTKIDLPDASSNDDKVVVTGRQANVEKAIAEINKIQEEMAKIVEQTLEISSRVQSRLLGNGKRLITDIEEECGGVQIRFPSVKSDSTKVVIRGPADDVAKAAKLLTDLAKDKEVDLAEDVVVAKPEFHRFLVGKGGAKINSIRAQHDVRVMFPRESDVDKSSIHLLGKSGDVAKVKALLESAIKQLEETVEEKINVDTKYHKNFFSRGGALLKEIQEQNGGLHILFPKNGTDSTEVTLKGSKQCVEAAKARIEDLVEDYEKQTTVTVNIPATFHRAILSNRAEKVNNIQSQFNVKIRFPDRREGNSSPENSDVVTISGRDTKVEQAQIALLALVPVSEVIQLPVDMHRMLIGKGGEKIRGIMQEFDVNISIPKDNASEDITVTGQHDNVQAALEGLRGKLVEYEGQQEDRKLRSFQLAIEIPHVFHQKIIGPRGATINAMRETHGVQINLPREGNSDTITIQGYQKNAEECAAAIEAIVAELRALFTQEISLDYRYHPRLIGSRGKNLAKVMEDYKVEIRLPRQGAEDPNLVVISGKDENDVYDCIEFLRGEEEDFLQEAVERTQFLAPRQAQQARVQQPSQIQISGAPWQLDLGSSEQFPDMSSGANATASAGAGAWGGARRW